MLLPFQSYSMTRDILNYLLTFSYKMIGKFWIISTPTLICLVTYLAIGRCTPIGQLRWTGWICKLPTFSTIIGISVVKENRFFLRSDNETQRRMALLISWLVDFMYQIGLLLDESCTKVYGKYLNNWKVIWGLAWVIWHI